MTIFKKIKDNLAFYSLAIILLLIFNYAINVFTYLDLPYLCHISLKQDVVSGNKVTMHKAINLLKKNDKASYKKLCRYVKTVSEKNCWAYDSRVEKLDYGEWQPGCYVKGSKTIYIKPEKADTDFVVKQRSEDIKKFMQMSMNFWKNYK